MVYRNVGETGEGICLGYGIWAFPNEGKPWFGLLYWVLWRLWNLILEIVPNTNSGTGVSCAALREVDVPSQLDSVPCFLPLCSSLLPQLLKTVTVSHSYLPFHIKISSFHHPIHNSPSLKGTKYLAFAEGLICTWHISVEKHQWFNMNVKWLIQSLWPSVSSL